MKRMMLVTLAVLAKSALALTETIDGIEWSCYTKNECVILEHPDASTPSNLTPLPVVSTSTNSLTVPSEIDGYPVVEIGKLAFQNVGASVIIIPASVSKISAYSFVGMSDGYNDKPSGEADLYYRQIPSTQAVFFLGDCPSIDDSRKMWRRKVGNGYWYAYITLVNTYGNAQFHNRTVYVVEGRNGWSVGDDRESFCFADVKYGAALATIAYNKEAGLVSISCVNPNAVIYYTIDGSDPVRNITEACHRYSAPIEIDGRKTIKALAVVDDYPFTVTSVKEIALGQMEKPEIVASQTPFNWSGNEVTLSTDTEDAEIRYTIDGSEPTEESALYVGPFTIDDTTTVKAKAFKTDWFESETAVATFTREWYTVEAPAITPGDTVFENQFQEVSIGCNTEGATIYYTTDGSDPKENGREYRQPFVVYNTCTVRAIAVKDDWKDSAEVTATFTRNEVLSAAANLYGYKMESGELAWVVDDDVSHDGVSSIKSSGNGSYVQTSVRGAGTLSFWWRAMCEEPEDGEYYDYGVFKVGSAEAAYVAGNDTGWIFISTNIATTGKHTLRWEYRKDDEGSFAPDCIWLDQVQWVPADGNGTTLTSPVPVKYSWLSGYNLGVAEGDFEASAMATAANGYTVWECYAVGMDPTDPNEELTITEFEMVDGKPVVGVNHKTDGSGNSIVPRIRLIGKENLSDEKWQVVPEEGDHNFRFFKAEIVLP